ncbi:MAG TPA: hypothetical protein VHD69_00495 [Candidatus Paceibacterota bacterium]|nr:hypothetical protein [Candidatus Paceibacterota bacterium]
MAIDRNPFSYIAADKAPEALRGDIRMRVASLERRAWTARLSALVALALASLSALVASALYVWNAVEASGFIQYVSLIFSDGPAMLAYSRELVWSLLESAPTFGFALVLGAGLISVGSVMSAGRLVRARHDVALTA